MSGKNYQEKRKHSTETIPFSYYASKIPDYFPSVPIHWHNEFEINRLISGKGEFLCGDKRYPCNAGDIVIIPPDALHTIYPTTLDSLHYDTLVFNSSMLYSSIGERSYNELILPLISGKIMIYPRIDSSIPEYNNLITFTDLVFKYAKNSGAINDLLLKSNLLHIFGTILKNHLYYEVKTSSKNVLHTIRPALEYIRKNYNKNISINELAKISHISPSYFMGCFKNATGISAVEYICQLRIKTACELIRDSENNISDIALECGFSNLSNFNRQFKEHLGITPSEYKKKMQNT